MELAGATALITGGAKRVGRTIALSLARRNVQVAISYRTSRSEADEAVKEIESLGVKGLAVKADVSKRREAEQLIQTAYKEFGRLDILVNNAAIFEETPFEALTEESWDKHLVINLKGPFLCAKAAASVMSQRGKILNIGDWSGIRPYKNYLPYCVSKAGVIALTKALALELAPKIQVNCICPGPVLLPEDFSKAQREEIALQVPLARIGSPEDVAAAVLFFLQSDFVTGAVLPVDGGRLIA